MTVSKRRLCAAALALLFAALALCGCVGGETQSDPADVLTTTAPLSGDLTTTQPQADEDTGENEKLEIDTYVILNDDATAIKGSGAAYADGVLTVSAPGVYSIKGKLTDGQIRVAIDGTWLVSGIVVQPLAYEAEDFLFSRTYWNCGAAPWTIPELKCDAPAWRRFSDIPFRRAKWEF